MKHFINKHLLLTSIFIVFVLCNSCEKPTIIKGTWYNTVIKLDYVDQNGLSLFSNNQFRPNRYNVDVTYIINGNPVDFYAIKESAEHQLEPYYFNEETDKKTINLFLNHQLSDNKATTIIKLKGYSADTIYGEFYKDQFNTVLQRCTINNTSYLSGEMITLVK